MNPWIIYFNFVGSPEQKFLIYLDPFEQILSPLELAFSTMEKFISPEMFHPPTLNPHNYKAIVSILLVSHHHVQQKRWAGGDY